MAQKEFKSVLITGGAGFIGSNFVRYFYHAHPKAHIVNLDLLTYAGNQANLADIEELEAALPAAERRYTFVQGDVCDDALLKTLFTTYKFDLVVHFAAESHVDRSIFNMSDFVRTNINGTRAIVDAVHRYHVPRLVSISTDEVYGSEYDGRATEEMSIAPSSPYAASKAGADLLVLAYMRTHKLPAIIVRGSNNYGPYQYPEKLIPIAITNMLEGKRIPVHGDGSPIRSWLHVADFCAAIDLLAHNADDHHVYNVAGEEKTNLEVLAALARHLNLDFDKVLHYVNDRPGQDRRYAPDASKLQKEFGWSPSYRFEEAIKDVVEWYTSNPDWWKNIRLKDNFLEHYDRQSNGRWV